MLAASRSASMASSIRRSIAAPRSCFRPSAALEANDQEFTYGRLGTPTVRALEEALPSLRAATPRCSRRRASRQSPRRSSRSSRRETMCSSQTASIGPTRRFCDHVLTRLGVETTYYDPLVGAGIKDLIKPNTKVVFTEFAGLADLRGAGHSGDRQRRACSRRRGGPGQHLGDAALLQVLRPWGGRVDPGGDQIYRRPCRRHARRHHRERKRSGLRSPAPMRILASALGLRMSISACAA